MAKGRQPGVLAFGFKSFLEAVIRQKEGLPFDQGLPGTADQKQKLEKKIDNEISDLREAMKLEKAADIKITGDAPHTKEVLNLFLSQLRNTFVEVESSGSLREQLLHERLERETLQKRLAELEAQLTRATGHKSGSRKAS